MVCTKCIKSLVRRQAFSADIQHEVPVALLVRPFTSAIRLSAVPGSRIWGHTEATCLVTHRELKNLGSRITQPLEDRRGRQRDKKKGVKFVHLLVPGWS